MCHSDCFVTVAIYVRNAYFFKYIILDPEKKNNVHEFNLPHIRKKTNKLKIYIYNPNGCVGRISKLAVKAAYLDRLK
jgi:hypothetical protein